MAGLDLRGRLTTGQPVFAAWVEVPAAAVVEALVGGGFEAAIFDMQHGGFDVSSATACIGAAALCGRPACARIPVGAFAAAARLLDAGAAAVIAPMIESDVEAAAFVEYTKYPPLGKRSWGPGRAVALTGLSDRDYFKAANDLHLSLAMIETRGALDKLDAILAVPGIDGVFVGPSDLSIGLSGGASVDPGSPDVEIALDRIAAAASAAGKWAGLFTFSGAQARRMVARGYHLVSIGTDRLLLRDAAREQLAAAR